MPTHIEYMSLYDINAQLDNYLCTERPTSLRCIFVTGMYVHILQKNCLAKQIMKYCVYNLKAYLACQFLLVCCTQILVRS